MGENVERRRLPLDASVERQRTSEVRAAEGASDGLAKLRKEHSSELNRARSPGELSDEYVEARQRLDATVQGRTDRSSEQFIDVDPATYYFAESKAWSSARNDVSVRGEENFRTPLSEDEAKAVREALPPEAAALVARDRRPMRAEVAWYRASTNEDWRPLHVWVHGDAGWYDLRPRLERSDQSDAAGDREASDSRESSSTDATRTSRPGIVRETRLESDRPLPHLREATLKRNHDGIIESVNGESATEFLNKVAIERARAWRELKDRNEVTRREVGPVICVAIDMRTGAMAEATNITLTNRDERADEVERAVRDLHPVLQKRLSEYSAEASAHGPYDLGGDLGLRPWKHFSEPGTHAEVVAVDRLLKYREAAGLPADESAPREFRIEMYNPLYESGVRPIECCANCTTLIPDVSSGTGKFTAYPPEPRYRLKE